MARPLVTIVNAGIKSRLRDKPRKPWMMPGAIGEIGAMITPDWDIVAWDEFVQGPIPIDRLRSSSLVALTYLTPSWYRAVDIAKQVRDINVPLIAGGRDVIGRSMEEGGLDELVQAYGSVCTTNLSPELMNAILTDCRQGEPKEHYALPDDASVELVMPRRDLLRPADYFAGWCVRSSQGCSRSCPWCTIGGKGFFLKEPSTLEAELRTIHHWFFIDVADSFANDVGFVREDVLPIYEKSGKRWGTELTVADVLEEDLVSILRSSGCRLLYIGVESIKRELSRKSSRKMAEEVILQCRKEGIVVIGSLMLDVMGDETEDEIREMIDWAIRWLDFAQFSLTALLPGCALRKKALRSGKVILPENWEKYGGAHATTQHRLNLDERARLLEEAYTRFSRFDHVMARVLRVNWWAKAPVLYGGLRYRAGIPRI